MSNVDDLDLEDLDDLDAEEEEKRTKRTPAKKDKPKGIGASAVAERLDADPKTFRAWLRNQVKAGNVDLDHDKKARYSWTNWKDPELIAIMKLWKESNHDRGGGKKKAAAKAPAKKTTRKRRKAS